MSRTTSHWRKLAILAALALTLTITPAVAQAKDETPSSAEHTMPMPAAPDPEAAVSDAPVATMPWPTEAPGNMMMDHGVKPKTFEGRLMRWLGGWHPAIVHFPIALLLTVALLEMLTALRRAPAYAAINKTLLAIGAFGALAAVPLGWANAGMPVPEDDFALNLHRWLGTALPFAFLLLWRLKPKPDAVPARSIAPAYVLMLAITVVAILVQSYFGAEVTHGAGHMAF